MSPRPITRPHRILFVCASLERGRDGVGDYTRLLADELAARDHAVSILASHDPYVDDATRGPASLAPQVPTLRLPASSPHGERLELARAFVREQQPAWISLQFVPYSFHGKGIPYRLADFLVGLGTAARWHVMFHELWVGALPGHGLRRRLVGVLQKTVILHSMRRLRPTVVSTQLPAHVQKLPYSDVALVPLFGNIPLAAPRELGDESREPFRIVYFGGFHEDIPGLRTQFRQARRYAEAVGRPPVLIALGGGGRFAPMALAAAAEALGPDSIVQTGYLVEREVDRLLAGADLGLSRGDAINAGKSGTTIAMLERGLPVILRGRQPAQPAVPEDSAGHLLYADDLRDSPKLVPLPSRRPPRPLLPEVADRYLALLTTRG